MDSTGFGILLKKVTIDAEKLTLKGLCALKIKTSQADIKLNRLEFRIRGNEETRIKTSFSIAKGIPFIKGYRLHGFRAEISLKDALMLDMQNKLVLFYEGEEVCSVTYNLLERRKGEFRNTRLVKTEGKTMYFRQSVNNKMWLVVRPENAYDSRSRKCKVFCAWLLSKIMGTSDHILMYEKEVSRYEESASVLFEKLIDQGYRNIYYIINRGNPVIQELDEVYRKQIVEAGSFRHLLLFFRCRTFVGTETVDHAVQLRAANKHIMKKLKGSEMTHVFLQHGVMYMVSLDADLRTGFVKTDQAVHHRTVVSSEAEAMHFILLGGFRREELYVTGLSKFDRSTMEEDADLIMIMPTWRRWETNLAQRDFTQTGYYRMLERMVVGVPEHLRDKIVIKPHPLMQTMMEQSESELSRFLRPDMSHDETLRHSILLITDYSSIAYDAFYRGANVIFCWEEKEQCMRHYGNAHLMINEYNAFGDVCYSPEQLRRAVEIRYGAAQASEHIRKYRRIVAFHDNRNTERIIDSMKKDQIL